MALFFFKENLISTPCKAIIHGCNRKGKMNSGVAKAIRENFPEAYNDYMKWVYKSTLGGIIISQSNDKLIGNLITQENYGYDGEPYASPIAIQDALDSFCYYWRGANLKTLDGYPPIASPKIGCGLGGLSWDNDVKEIFEWASKKHDIDFYIYDMNGETGNNEAERRLQRNA